MRLPNRKSSSHSNGDRFAITPAQVDTLAEQVRDPLTHTERCVDELAFLPAGGHRWTRKLQILIPASAAPPERSWRILSLGVFPPRRYPDFTVHDCSDQRLNLLTRRQHGLARTEALLTSHIWKLYPELQKRQRASKPNPATATYAELYAALYTVFTTIDGESPASKQARARAGRAFIMLLRLLGLPLGNEVRQRVAVFAADLRQTVRATEYLCWAKAGAGEVINLSATYTSKDVLHDLAPLKDLTDALGSIWKGAVEEPRQVRRRIQAKWYVQYGLAPIKYRLAVPSDQRSRSYYFTVAAPERSDVTYLDWEDGNSIADDGVETDSAVPALHLHNHDAPSAPSSAAGHIIRTYVRCSPNEHKKIAAGALINAIFVFLIAYGHLRGSPNQEWLLVTPTVLLAYLAQQQRHYFAHTTRRQRAVVWGYLIVSVLFLSTIAFNNVSPRAGSEGWGWFTLVVAWLFAVTSVAVCAWYAPLGYSFQRITERRTRRATEHQPPGSEALSEPMWRVYDRVVHSYCDRIMGGVVGAMALATVIAAVTWHLPSERPTHPHGTKRAQQLK